MMKSLPALILPVTLLAGASNVAMAQAAPKPVTVLTVRSDGMTARPKPQAPGDAAAKSAAQSERLSIQSDLAWTSFYNGGINGEASERMTSAIKAFQKDQGAKETGTLTPQERAALADAARKLQENVGWKIVTDMVTGARIGLPLKLLAKNSADMNGSKWSSSTGTIQISLDRRKEAGATTASIADTEKKKNARKIEYAAVKPDFFVLSGVQGLKKFYIRGQTSNNEVRVMTVLYDQATEGTMIPVTVAMSSAFIPFPTSAANEGPPPRKKVEYSTGLVVGSDGSILADRQAVEECTGVIVAGYGNADRIAQDEASDLALLRLYGVSGLQPLSMSGGAAKPEVIVTGIADPQAQGGGSAVSSASALIGPDNTLSPSPATGFSGAPLIDGSGRFAGITRVRPVTVAGPAAPSNQSTIAPASKVREFLHANNITPPDGPSNAKAAIVRLICIRK